MTGKTITGKLLSVCLAVSLFTTSFGGAFAASVSAAAPAAQAEETAQAKPSPKGIVAAIAAVGLIAALSSHGGSSAKSSSPAKSAGSSGGQSQTPAPSGASASEEQQALTLVNKDRAANGLPALKANSQLTQLARNYAKDMISRGFFSHYNPEGLSPFDRMNRAGISYKTAGENLAVDTSVAAAEKSFMNSSGHRANILNRAYTEVGIGVVHSSNGSLYVVQEFIGK